MKRPASAIISDLDRWLTRAMTVLTAMVLVASARTAAATDEIQVYNAGIAAPGQFTVQQHLNYVGLGVSSRRFRAVSSPTAGVNGTPEFAYGVTDWWEPGLIRRSRSRTASSCRTPSSPHPPCFAERRPAQLFTASISSSAIRHRVFRRRVRAGNPPHHRRAQCRLGGHRQPSASTSASTLRSGGFRSGGRALRASSAPICTPASNITPTSARSVTSASSASSSTCCSRSPISRSAWSTWISVSAMDRRRPRTVSW